MLDKALELAQAYAKSKGTAVLDYKANDDGTITIILVSGPKLRLTPEQIQQSVDEKNLQLKIAQAQLEAANQVIKGKTSLKFFQDATRNKSVLDDEAEAKAEAKAKAKAEAKAKAKAEAEAKATGDKK